MSFDFTAIQKVIDDNLVLPECVIDFFSQPAGLLEAIAGKELSNQVEAVGDAAVKLFHPELTVQPTKNWFMGSFADAVTVATIYLLFVIFGTFIMKALFGGADAEKVKGSLLHKIVKEPMIVLALIYNPVQVVLCAYMIIKSIAVAQSKGYSFICNSFNANDTDMASILWVFYLSKILDFTDTVIIIARRKWVQLSFLHVYHHISIFLFYWLNTRAGYDGDIYYTIALNSFIHLLMYSYYQCTTLEIPVPTPIKKLITNLQMLQFITMISQALYMLYFGCAYPRLITIVYAVYIFSLFLLFQNFANNTYGKKADKKTAKDGDKKVKTGTKTNKAHTD